MTGVTSGVRTFPETAPRERNAGLGVGLVLASFRSSFWGGLWLLLSAAPAAATIDLVGATSATFAWSPGSGPPVAGYVVGLSLNSASPVFYQTVSEPRVTVQGNYGDEVSIAVIGYVSGTRVSPPSEFSEPVRFVAPASPPPPAPPPPASPPVTSELWFWNPSTGAVLRWEMDGAAVRVSHSLTTLSGGQVVATVGDLDADGDDDLLLYDVAGDSYRIAFVENGSLAGSNSLPPPPPGGVLAGAGYVDEDGYADLLWEVPRSGPFSTADVVVWYLGAGGQVARTGTLGAVADDETVVGALDLRADGTVDLLLRDERGSLFLAMVDAGSISSVVTLAHPGTSWNVAATPDLNGDGRDEILMRSLGGSIRVVFPTGGSFDLGNYGADFSVAGTPDLDGNGWDDLLLRSTGGVLEVLFLKPGGLPESHLLSNGAAAWTPLDRYRILPGS